jgi:hypothetical protein
MRNRFCGLLLTICAIWPAGASLALDRINGEADRSASDKSPAKANDASQAVEVREFEVRVDNVLRGKHRLITKFEGKNELAEIQTDVKVDVIVYVYSFKSRGNETWREGRLVNSEIRVDDNGKKRMFSLTRESDIQQISFNDKPVKTSKECVMSTSYWRLPNAELLSKPMSVVDVDSGKTFNATLIQVGTDTVTVGSRTISCRHFKIDGVSPAELWFDDRDRLVKQTSVEQGHATELRLKTIRTSNDAK